MLDGFKKPKFEGEILICEDNAMNQQVACEYLTKSGFKTTVAENGKIGVDMVQSRMQKGEKQFDLIFMDIHMPVMSGLEAAEKILALGLGIPIIAMTANIMPDDIEAYKEIGMNDCIGKPFTSQELWHCLVNYFNPVSWQTEDKTQGEQDDNELRQKLIRKFVENYRGVFGDITNAINAGDINLAHRIAHNLKSNAGQLDKVLLQQAAEEVENSLKNGKNLTILRQMNALENELNEVIKELAPMAYEQPTPSPAELMDAIAARKLLEELEPMLNDSDLECMSFINELRLIPGSEELIRQIENFEFKLAMEALVKLIKR